MNKNGPIVIIEDDLDDQDLYRTIFEELKVENPLVFWGTGAEAMEYLAQESVMPFLIISDINMPGLNGFQVRERIRCEPKILNRCIPYLFFTTDASPSAVQQAYALSVQGIFQKPSNFQEWIEVLGDVVRYWRKCMSPGRNR